MLYIIYYFCGNMDIRRILQNVTLLQLDLVQNDNQMFHVKYKLFRNISTLLCLIVGGGQVAFFQNFYAE